MMSIRNRLVLWLLLPLVPASVLFIWVIIGQVRATTQAAYDQVLLGSALAIADRVVVENDALSVDVPYAALQMLTRAAEERVFYAVVSLPDLGTVTGYRNMPLIDLNDESPTFATQEFRGEEVRIVALKDRALSYGQELGFAVYVAETTGRRNLIGDRLFRLGLLAGTLLIIGTTVMTLLAVHWGLRPLRLLADAISERDGNDLRPIVRRSPPEAAALVTELNALLKRLKTTLNSHRNFVRTTSHQLRTPLAEIKSEIELAAERGEALDKISLANRVDGLSRLVGQILLLSRVEDQHSGVEPAQQVDLVDVGRRAVARHWSKAHAAGIDLGLETSLDRHFVAGNAALLDEAINNLVDNVLIHAHQAGTATIRVDEGAISVSDDAPGPKRLATTLEGERTGRFGLSIVRQIAQMMQASVAEVPGGLELRWSQDDTNA